MALRRYVALGAAVALLAIPGVARAYSPLSSSEIVKRLNDFRAANGFPANVQHDAKLSAGCEAHNRWMQANGKLQHEQIPGTRYASEAGKEAGNGSVLAWGATWRHGNPWLNAPVHLADTLIPGMVHTGASERYERNCLRTHTFDNLNPDQPAEHVVYSYPKDGGSAPYYQIVDEAPAPPQAIGANPIKAGTPTGPNLIVFLYGPMQASTFARMTGAMLTGPSGTVPIKWHSDATLTYLPPYSGLIIPRAPLKPGATYTYTTTWMNEEQTYVTPARTFTATNSRLCGTGVNGWGNGVGCPGGSTGGSGSTRTAPAAPKASQVKIVGTTPRLGALGRSGSFRLRFPVKAKRVKAVGVLTVTAKQARTLGLSVKKGQKTVTIGSARATTSTKAGPLTVTVRLTGAAKTAFTRAGRKGTAVRSVRTSFRLTLSTGTAKAKPVAKTLTFKK